MNDNTENNTKVDDTPRPWWSDEKIAALNECKLLSPHHGYMRNAHLLPPRDEFETLGWYVAVLKLFERAPASLPMYRFMPTLAQRRHNAETLMKWEAQQRHSHASVRGDTGTDRRLTGWLENAFLNVIEDVRATPGGERNTRLHWAARRLAELGFTETESKSALMEASAHWNWSRSGTAQCETTFESGWRKGINTPVDLSDIATELAARDD